MLINFKEIVDKIRGEKKRTVAVAMAEDKDVLIAIEKARSQGLTDAILTGNADKIRQNLNTLNINEHDYNIINADDEKAAVNHAIVCVKDNQAQVLMKGLCSTTIFLKGLLDKDKGLRSGKVISHLALFESERYHKLFMMSDAAMNIAPDLATKIAITENAIDSAHKLGYPQPKVAILSAVEKINVEAIQSSVDAAVISKMGERGQIKGAVIDGPLAVDNALSTKACEVKGLSSPVGGDSDICIVPNIETGNAFYKLLTILGGG